MTFDQANRTLHLDDMQLGEYEFSVTLTDEFNAESEYTFKILIVKPQLFQGVIIINEEIQNEQIEAKIEKLE